jgi:hypothetical protein
MWRTQRQDAMASWIVIIFNSFFWIFVSFRNERLVPSKRELHALHGNAMALFLAGMLIEAIHELAASNSSNRIEL